MASPVPPGPAPPAARSASATEQSIVERRDARRERRRLAQASPGEGRNSRPSGTGNPEGGQSSPTRTQQTPPRASSAGGEGDADMSRYGLVAEPSDAASPIVRPPRRRMSSAGGGVTPSEYGSELGSPLRRHGSHTDLHSSHDSLDSLAAASRASRRGSGFKKRGSPVKGAKATAAKNSFADLHILGEIVGASGFQFPMLFCRWQLLYEPSKSWQVLRGQQQGTTHACCSAVGEVDLVVWEHPLDIHVKTQSLQGWPSLLLMVYARDEGSGRDSFVSYALVPLPSTPGMHHISSHTWFALERSRALGRSFFAWHTGLIPRLEDETFITDLRKREDAGPFIHTVGAGEVHLRLSILTKNLEQVTHQGGESLAAALERLTTNILRQSTTLANKSMAQEEHRLSSEALTEGQKLVRGGREERMASARAALDSRRRSAADGASPAPSESSRTSMRSPGGPGVRSSFKGFGGMRQSTSPRRLGSDIGGGAQDDDRSEVSFDRGAGGYTPARDRYALRAARRAEEQAEKEAAEAAKAKELAATQEGASVSASGAADGAPAIGGKEEPGPGPSRSGSGSGAAAPGRSSSGGVAQAASGMGRVASGVGRTASGGRSAVRRPSEDDGLETIEGGEGGGVASAGPGSEDGGGPAGGREDARAARRAKMRSAF